jgi:protein-tyrosine-phosphatase
MKRGSKVKKVLFVCSGNTCRSPMAKELFTRFLSCREGGSLAYEYQASSAGIWAADGLPASPEALEVMGEEYAIDLSGHRSRRLNQELVDEADLILVMTRDHYHQMVERYQSSRDKTFILSEWAGYQGQEVSDPFGMGKESYKRSAEQLESMLEGVIKKLSRGLK